MLYEVITLLRLLEVVLLEETSERALLDFVRHLSTVIDPSCRINRAAVKTLRVITSYSIHYTKLYDLEGS